ncbi:hypothetical protein BHE74_00048641 [Ensete ventricosum]|nr:hypothetical protein BHE74_00048641 [Ensete ventricosum]
MNRNGKRWNVRRVTLDLNRSGRHRRTKGVGGLTFYVPLGGSVRSRGWRGSTQWVSDDTGVGSPVGIGTTNLTRYIYISRHGRKTTRVDKASRMQTDGRAGIKRQLSDSCSPLIDEQNTFLGSSQGIQSADDDPTSPVPANSAALIYGTI